MVDNKRAGSYTITQDNETGSWLLPEYQNKGIGTIAYKQLLKLEPRDHYKAIKNEFYANQPIILTFPLKKS